jgi:hypothetical protein
MGPGWHPSRQGAGSHWVSHQNNRRETSQRDNEETTYWRSRALEISLPRLGDLGARRVTTCDATISHIPERTYTAHLHAARRSASHLSLRVHFSGGFSSRCVMPKRLSRFICASFLAIRQPPWPVQTADHLYLLQATSRPPASASISHPTTPFATELPHPRRHLTTLRLALYRGIPSLTSPRPQFGRLAPCQTTQTTSRSPPKKYLYDLPSPPLAPGPL